jgi:hypothetical protein
VQYVRPCGRATTRQIHHLHQRGSDVAATKLGIWMRVGAILPFECPSEDASLKVDYDEMFHEPG